MTEDPIKGTVFHKGEDVSRDQWLKSQIIDAVREHAKYSDSVLRSIKFEWKTDKGGIFIDRFTVQWKHKGKKQVLILE